MPLDRSELGLGFDRYAALYDRFRPAYPTEVFDALAAMTQLRGDAHVLEIGCGTGQATTRLLDHGWRVTALEPGRDLASIAHDKCTTPLFDVNVVTFEEWDPASRSFDLVFSANAYHWIDPKVRWTKPWHLLRAGAPLAILACMTVGGSSFNEFYSVTQELHDAFDIVDRPGPSTLEDLRDSVESAGDDIGLICEALWQQGTASPSAGPTFTPAQVRFFPWSQSYTPEGAVGLLATYSPYMELREDQRAELFEKLKRVVEIDFHGELVRNFVAVLIVALAVK